MQKNSNPFKNLNTKPKQLPVEIRKKVMDDVAIASLFMDLTFLVTDSYPSALKGLFKTIDSNEFN